jgi:hypothetical protein
MSAVGRQKSYSTSNPTFIQIVTRCTRKFLQELTLAPGEVYWQPNVDLGV